MGAWVLVLTRVLVRQGSTPTARHLSARASHRQHHQRSLPCANIMSAGASTTSSATDVDRDHDVGVDTDAPPQLSALFLIRFDKKVGYVIFETD